MNTQEHHTTRLNWIGWILSTGLVLTLAGGGWQAFRTWRLIHLGESPLHAFQLAQEETRHIVFRPWVLTSYALFLVLALWQLYRFASMTPKQTSYRWTAVALVVSIAMILFNILAHV